MCNIDLYLGEKIVRGSHIYDKPKFKTPVVECRILIGQNGDPCHEDFDDLRAARLLEMQQQQDFKKNFPERKKNILHQNFSSI